MHTPMLLALFVAVGTGACDENSDSAAPQVQDQEIVAAMEAAIQDEYKAELIYQKVIEDFGEVRPFVNIIGAEVRHSESLARLFSARDLPVPQSQWKDSDIPGFSSISAACQAGVRAEIENAEIYDRFFALNLPADVRRVFENNRRASIENHLRAFQRCS